MMRNEFSMPAESLQPTYSISPYLFYLLTFTSLTIISFLLTPSSAGYGTHQQLGLPPCGFLMITGYPCPSCGLTTSWAYLVRGEILNSLKAQPFGTLFYAALFFGAFISVISIWKRIPAPELLDSGYTERMQYGLLIIFFAGWFYKMIVMKWMP